jgi:hypothetical protein
MGFAALNHPAKFKDGPLEDGWSEAIPISRDVRVAMGFAALNPSCEIQG